MGGRNHEIFSCRIGVYLNSVGHKIIQGTYQQTNFNGEVFVEGSGEMGTFAQKEKGNTYAGASSYGNYEYTASAGGGGTGLIGVGGLGLTGGGSYVHNGGNNVSAVSGQVTISAAGALNTSIPDQPTY